MPESRVLVIRWNDDESAGYDDLIPGEWFSKEGRTSSLFHDLKGPRGDVCPAKCDLMVEGRFAELRYGGRNASFNQKQDVDTGALRIKFKDDDRLNVRHILWKDEDDGTDGGFVRTDADAEWIERDPLDAAEGGLRLAAHLHRERNRALVKRKIADVRAKSGRLACEACGFDFEEFYGSVGEGYCEVHHRAPLSEGGVRRTSLTDLAILCANCHRMIHRIDPLLDVQAFAGEHVRSSTRGR